MPRTLRPIFFTAMLAGLLSGCGNKGPLVLPDPAPAPPAAQDKDKSKPASAPQVQPSGDAAKKN